jgi:hypothetical protein
MSTLMSYKSPWVGPFVGGMVAAVLFDYVPEDSRHYAVIVGIVVGFAFSVFTSPRAKRQARHS